MRELASKIIGLVLLFSVLGSLASAQSAVEKLVKSYSCSKANEIAVSDYFTNFKEQQKQIADEERKKRESQIAQFGRVKPKISGHCWSGCPIRLVKPFFPQEAKRQRIFGQIIIETIVDENGKVIFAHPQKANPFFSRVARQAACLSSYTPQFFEGKAVRFSWIIIYNFILE